MITDMWLLNQLLKEKKRGKNTICLLDVFYLLVASKSDTQTRFSSRGFLSLFYLIDLSLNLSIENLG